MTAFATSLFCLTRIYTLAELRTFDVRLDQFVANVDAPVDKSRVPFVYHRFLDRDRESGIGDEEIFRILEELDEAGAKQIYILDESIFSDLGAYRSRLPGIVTVLDSSAAASQVERSLLFQPVDDILDVDGRLRAVPWEHPAAELCRNILESGDILVEQRGSRVFLRPPRRAAGNDSGIGEQEGSSVHRLLESVTDPEFRPSMKDRTVIIDRGILEASFAQIPTPTEVLTTGGVYSRLLRSMFYQWNIVEIPFPIQCLGFLTVVGGFCWFSSGLKPYFVGGVGAVAFGVTLLLGWMAIPLGVDFSFVALCFGLFVAISAMVFLEMKRSREILQSFGGAEDAAFEGEESEATMLFTNIPPFLMAMERVGNKNLLAYRRDYNEILAVIARRYHGKVLDYQGDAQMLGFGLRHDDDREHAAEAASAAIEIVDAVKSLAERWNAPQEKLQVHVGVCTGKIALGHLGAVQKQDIAAIGDTTNTAARLMGAAMKQNVPVLVAKSSYLYAEGAITGIELEKVELKGKAQAVEVFGEIEVDSAWRAVNRAKTKETAVSSGGTLAYKGDNRSNLAMSVIFGTIGILVSYTLWSDKTYLQPELYLLDSAHRTFAYQDADPRILLVGIDEASISDPRMGHFPWSRGVYAQIIRNLRDSGYKGLFIDVMFKADRRDDQVGDQAFADALAEDPRVVVAAVLQRNANLRLEAPKLFSLADMGLLTRRFQLGLIHSATETDDVAREAFVTARETASHHSEEAEKRTLFPFAAPALLLEEGDRFELDGDSVWLGDFAVPVKVQDRKSGSTSITLRYGPSTTADGLPPQSGSYRFLSANRLMDPTDPIFGELEGKYLMMGQALTTGEQNEVDRIETVMGRVKGVEVHARALDNLLNRNFLKHSSSGASVLQLILTGVLTISLLTVLRNSKAYLAGLLVLTLSTLVFYVGALFFFGYIFEVLAPLSTILIVSASVLIGRYILTYRALTMVVPAEVVKELLYHHSVQDRRQVATILLTDIRGYTTLSEGRSAVAMLDVLNEYHKRTVACYERYGGQALTYQGDAQIVVFGVFGNRENPAADAAQAALGLQAICDQLREEWGIESRADFDVGAGLCTGEVEVGLLGGGSNLQYSVVGETVRKAHKVQGMSTDLDAAVIMDEETYLAAAGAIVSDDLGLVQPSGLTSPIRLFRAKSVLPNRSAVPVDRIESE